MLILMYYAFLTTEGMMFNWTEGNGLQGGMETTGLEWPGGKRPQAKRGKEVRKVKVEGRGLTRGTDTEEKRKREKKKGKEEKTGRNSAHGAHNKPFFSHFFFFFLFSCLLVGSVLSVLLLVLLAPSPALPCHRQAIKADCK
jgi:hypothetical protein